jgi:hypothetical protein
LKKMEIVMKKFTLGFALLIALTSQQPLMASPTSDWNKLSTEDKGMIISAGILCLIAGGAILLSNFEDYLDGSTDELVKQIMDNLEVFKGQFSEIPDTDLSAMENALNSGEILSLDDLDPAITTALKQGLLKVSEQYLGITDPQDITSYENIINAGAGSGVSLEDRAFDDLAKNISTYNPKIQSAMEEYNANFSEALKAVQSEIQVPKVPEIPVTGSGDTPVAPSTGTGSTVLPPAANDSFEQLQSVVTQNISNIKSLSATDLSNLRSTIQQQLTTAQENLKNATDEAATAKAQEDLQTAKDNADKFNEEKPAGEDPVEVE